MSDSLIFHVSCLEQYAIKRPSSNVLFSSPSRHSTEPFEACELLKRVWYIFVFHLSLLIIPYPFYSMILAGGLRKKLLHKEI